MEDGAPESQNLLIVGDWVIDEYWILVKHYSEISSHTGYNHYRLSSQSNETVADLCGAGHVARVLYQLNTEEHPDSYKIVGLGKWDDADTELISHLVHAQVEKECDAARAWYRLSPRMCKKLPGNVTLMTLASESPTNRVIRQYYLEKGKLRQLNRVDWEPQSPGGEVHWDSLQLPEEVAAIVVNDLAKGVVTLELVRKLKERYPHARWYVRSKQRTPRELASEQGPGRGREGEQGIPPWLRLVKDDLELLVVGPEMAALLNPWDSWLVNRRITLQALDIIKGLPGKNVVLLSDRREVIGRLNDSEHCLTAQSLVEPSPVTQLGWPSAFFAALVHTMYANRANLAEADIRWALNYADKKGGVHVPIKGADDTGERQPDVRMGGWAEESDEWEQAKTDFGIIRARTGELRLDVWRGVRHLPGYIACVKEKQNIIVEIGRHLRAFNESRQMRSLSIMLQADPGAGKTHLTKSLAEAFNFSFQRFDITQMIHRDELLDLFDTIATAQANEEKKLLVFVDEINARLDNDHVYGAFLAPLEESIFVRRGKSFSLRPCVWVFAGTKLDEEKPDDGGKLKDFRDRMTIIEKIDFGSLSDRSRNAARLQKEAQLEQVYLGAAMIGRHFPDVQNVSKEVLVQFYNLKPESAPSRKIRKWAASLRNVQYGNVTRANCEGWPEWDKIKDGDRPVMLSFE